MKKVIASILCVAMLLPTVMLPASAKSKSNTQQEDDDVQVSTASSLESAFAEGENSIILFVTGIGQSFSYYFDESYTEEGAFENGTLQDYENYAPLIAEGKYSGRWNLFSNMTSDAIKQPSSIKAILKLVGGLFLSIFTRKNMVKSETVETLLSNLFSYNIIDENGKGSDQVVTPRYVMPVSEYPQAVGEDGKMRSEAKERFYGSIPCAEIAQQRLGDNYEDYLYCYNYCAFSYTSQNVEGLHEYIETVLANNKVGAKQVVLVPMSMGASVVSAYLAQYPDRNDNHVRRVVSIVGCWDGSDVVADLIEKKYADGTDGKKNSAQLFYNGLISDMIGEPWGYLVNVLIRIFPKTALTDLANLIVDALCDKILLNTPSLVALVPSDRYEAIRPLIKSDNVRAETDKYYEAQKNLKNRFEALTEQGITFSFIAGYGLPYGAVTSDYQVFGFMYSAEKTNSDEIINIDSTAPGTEYVAYDKQFVEQAGDELSPDKTIKINNTYFKDSTWYFYGQKHELEYNNVAISCAIDLALGTIKTVNDENCIYPQFNNSRNLKRLKRDWLNDLDTYCRQNNYTLTADQQALYDEVIAMTNTVVINTEKEESLLEKFHDMLVEIGVYAADEEPSKFDEFLNNLLKKNNDVIYKLYGAKGYLDFGLDSVC